MKKFTFFSYLNLKSVGLCALLMVFSIGYAQNPYTIQFQDETIEMPENITTFEWNQMPDNSRISNGYVGWVQFYETPRQEVQDRFAANNLKLINYIPHHTYLFHFPENTSISFLEENGVRSIVPVETRFKMSQDLKNGNIGDWAILGDFYLVTIQYHDMVPAASVLNELAAMQISVHEQYQNSDILDLIVPNDKVEDLAELSFVKWAEVIIAPSVPDDVRGRAIHRANNLDTMTPGGRDYDGEGVGVLCRDDGAVGPHIDFNGRHFGLIGANGSGHGDGVSGIMAGSGNLNPTRRGMAAGADLWVVNYVSSFLDTATTTLINDGTVQITNSSYSNGCNAGYTSITRTVDMQITTEPTLLHVFSAGNSNNNNCGYGAGSQWGNITGGHKQGKNVIATANTYYDGVLVNSSSRGPAHDGRIKPDISAHGQGQISTQQNHTYQTFGGTSAAAPGIAGVSAMLYNAYMDANGGAFPESALIKAALLNTATDYGNVGPDFKFGFGMVNGLRAAILIEDDRYLDDTATQGNTNTHMITVPAGATQVRFMLHWSDVAASAGANPALVNDLDLEVVDPGNNTLLPYLLDHTPNPVNLDTPAGNGPDHLNNVEQVLINAPAAGTYDIEVTGFNVPQGPQKYYVVWEIITESLTVTYPNEGEKLYPLETATVHWEAVNTTDPFTLEYSIDNGANWNLIANIGASERNYDWTLPLDITGEGLFRVTSGAFSDTSDGNFSIARFPSGLSLDEVCETDATFSWIGVADAEMYDLYILGPISMEIAGSTSDTEITIPIADPNDPMWYAIAARNDTEGWESRRTNAVFYNGGMMNCVLGVDDIALGTVALYPNPASDQVFVAFNSATAFDTFNVKLTNILGQTLQTLDERALNGTTEAAINVANYRSGVYFVTIEIDGQSTTKKLVIK